MKILGIICLISAVCLAGGCSAIQAKNEADLGAAAFAENDFKKSTEHFERAVEGDPNSTEHLTLLGWSYYKIPNYDKAIATFEKLGRMDPKAEAAYNGRGWSNFKMGNNDQAIHFFEKAIEIDPNDSVAYGGLGWAHFKKGNVDIAEKYFFAAMRKGIKYGSSRFAAPEAHRGLGYLNFSKKNYDTALRHYKIAVQGIPDWNDARAKWAECLFIKEKYAQAIPVYERVLQHGPKTAEIYDKLGWSYHRLKGLPRMVGRIEYWWNEEHARDMFKKALAIDPNYASSLSGLAELGSGITSNADNKSPTIESKESNYTSTTSAPAVSDTETLIITAD